MHVISRRKLHEASVLHGDLLEPLDIWYRIAKKANWTNLVELRQDLPAADLVGKVIVFNIKGNHYRLITEIFFASQVILVRHVLTHGRVQQRRLEMIALGSTPTEASNEYAHLLSESLPTVIDSDGLNELYVEQVAGLLQREDSLSIAESQLLKLLTLLIEDFEERNYALPMASPLAVVAFLMEQHGLKQKDLSDVFGSPSITSEVLSGKRDLNKEQIRRLSSRFHVSPELFF